MEHVSGKLIGKQLSRLVAEIDTSSKPSQGNQYRTRIDQLLKEVQSTALSAWGLALFEFRRTPSQSVTLVGEASPSASLSAQKLFGLRRNQEIRAESLAFPGLWRAEKAAIAEGQVLEDLRELGVCSLISVPLKIDGDSIGRLLLWSPQGLDCGIEELSYLENLCRPLAGALRRWRTQEELHQISGLAVLTSEISRRFINSPAEDLEEAMVSSLELLGECLAVDSASIYVASEDLSVTTRAYDWLREGAHPEPEASRRVTLGLFPWFARCYREGTPVAVSSIYDVPSYATAERAMVASLRAKAFLGIPMRVSGRTVGHVGFGHQRRSRRWSTAEIEQMRAVGDLFALAVDRFQNSTALSESNSRYQTIVDDLSLWILRWDPDGTRSFVNRSYCERFGRTAQELIGTNFLKEAHPEDRNLVLRKIGQLSPSCPVLSDRHPVRQTDGTSRWEEWTDRGFFNEDGQLVEIQSAGRDVTEDMMIREREEARHHAFQQQLLHLQETERARIAQGLHDELGQSLTGMGMQLRNLQKRTDAEGKTEISGKELSQLLETVERVIPEVRRICAELRPSSLDHLGLQAAMESHLERFSESTGIEVHKEFSVGTLTSDATRDINLFRIFQEILTNVAKHSGASHVWVRFTPEPPDSILLEIHDNGCGIAPPDRVKPGHFGLLGLHERALILGADLRLDSEPGDGLRVRLLIPRAGISQGMSAEQTSSFAPGSAELEAFMRRHG